VYLFGYGLAVIPSTAEKKVASRIYRVPDSNQAVYVPWPAETLFLFELGNFNAKYLQPCLQGSRCRDGSKRTTHGEQNSYNKDPSLNNNIHRGNEIALVILILLCHKR
jgi:hypothetical protein